MTTHDAIADRIADRIGVGIADGTPNSPTPLFPCPPTPERHRPSISNWRQAHSGTDATTHDRHAWMALRAIGGGW